MKKLFGKGKKGKKGEVTASSKPDTKVALQEVNN